MKASELRIGNLISYCNQPVNIMGLNNECVELGYFIDSIGFERELPNNDIQPIPLTEEWLEKFGFKVHNEKAYLLQNYTVDLNGNFWIINHKLSGNIKYAHQLQNLYFSLTGKELEIK